VKSVVESDFPFPGVNHFERLPGARSTHVTRVKEGVGLFTHAHGPTVSHLRKALFIRTPETHHLPDKRPLKHITHHDQLEFLSGRQGSQLVDIPPATRTTQGSHCHSHKAIGVPAVKSNNAIPAIDYAKALAFP